MGALGRSCLLLRGASLGHQPLQGDPSRRCRCTPEIATRYLRKLSGPLLDRINIQIELPALSPAELSGRSTSIGKTSAIVAEHVASARDRQLERQGKTNHELDGREVDAVCRLDATGKTLLREAGERFGWSARAYYRVLKVERTIADLAAAESPTAAHLAEAIQCRRAFTMRIKHHGNRTARQKEKSPVKT